MASLLDHIIANRRPFNERDLRDLVQQLARTLSLLHKHGVVHRSEYPPLFLPHRPKWYKRRLHPPQTSKSRTSTSATTGGPSSPTLRTQRRSRARSRRTPVRNTALPQSCYPPILRRQMHLRTNRTPPCRSTCGASVSCCTRSRAIAYRLTSRRSLRCTRPLGAHRRDFNFLRDSAKVCGYVTLSYPLSIVSTIERRRGRL